MTALQAYNQFKKQNDLPIFLEDWYLDIACSDGQWSCTYYEEDGVVLALYFYFLKQKWGLKYMTMPTMVKYMGPVFAAHVSEHEKGAITQSMESKLPTSSAFVQQWMPNTFQLLLDPKINISYISRDTFIWNCLDNEDLLAEMDGNYRRAIKKYNTTLLGESPKSLEDKKDQFITLLESGMGSLKTHGIAKEQLIKLIDALEVKQKGKLICLYSEQVLLAASLVCWDDNKAYYLFAAGNKAYNKWYPGVQMAWSTMQYLKEHTEVKQLDFLGSSIPSIAKVWSKLGADKKHYPLVSQKSSIAFFVLNKLKQIFKKNG